MWSASWLRLCQSPKRMVEMMYTSRRCRRSLQRRMRRANIEEYAKYVKEWKRTRTKTRVKGRENGREWE